MTQVNSLPYCVYSHSIGDHVIYIGSGEISRAFALHARREHHLEMMNCGELTVTILHRFTDRNEAFRVEKMLLETFRPSGNVRVGSKAKYVRTFKRTVRPTEPRKPKLPKRTASVLQMLIHAAERNAPCPTNKELSCVVGCEPANIQRLIAWLAKNGYINVTFGSNYRIVTVNGHATAPTKDVNVKNIATVRQSNRKVDWMIV